MLLLLDESVPRKLRLELPDHEVRTVQQQGWSAFENGELLTRAESSGFQGFITADQNLQYQQNLKGRKIRIVVVAAYSNSIEVLVPLMPQVLRALTEMGEGELRVVSG